jgi:ribosomal protein S12 methylthiotransferase
VGKTLEVLVEGTSDEHEYVLMGRHGGQAPEIDGQVYLSGGEARPGTLRRVHVAQASDYDVVGELIDDDQPTVRRGLEPRGDAASAKTRIGLRVVPASYR